MLKACNTAGFSLSLMTLGVRKSNLSGITPADTNESIPNLVDLHGSRDDNVQEILSVIDRLGAKWGRLGQVQRMHAAGYFCLQNEITFSRFLNDGSSPNWATTRESTSPRNTLEGIFENFQFMGDGSFSSKCKGFKHAQLLYIAQ